MLRKSLAAALLCAACALLPAKSTAQGAGPIILPSGCGTASYPNSIAYFTIDATGRLCDGISSSGAITNPASTLTLPAVTTAYTVGQLMANSATAGAVVNPSFAIANNAGGASIPRLRLSTNDTTSTAWGAQTIQVDLWTATPTWTNGDRGTWSPATGTGAHLGSYTCLMSAEYGDGAYAECYPAVGQASLVKLAAGTTIFWSLQAVTGSGVTGSGKVFTLVVELQN